MMAVGRGADGHGAARVRGAGAGVSLAVHTHVNAAQSLTPLVAQATQGLFEAGVRDVRNQGGTAARRERRRAWSAALEADDPLALSREYPYYDPVHLLPDEGRAWWLARAAGPELVR